jgi:hypothetical protein
MAGKRKRCQAGGADLMLSRVTSACHDPARLLGVALAVTAAGWAIYGRPPEPRSHCSARR